MQNPFSHTSTRRTARRLVIAGVVASCAWALAGCGSTAPAINNPALGANAGSMGISGSSASGVQIYGVTDVSYGSSRTTTTGGSTSRTGF